MALFVYNMWKFDMPPHSRPEELTFPIMLCSLAERSSKYYRVIPDLVLQVFCLMLYV